MTIKEIKQQSKINLKGNWNKTALFMLVYGLLIGAISGVSTFTVGIIFLLAAGPFALGLHIYFYNLVNNSENAEIENMFSGFKNFTASFIIYILQDILIFLWSLLLIVPGIIKSIAYSMSYFVFLDDPTLGASECISRSQQLMKGYKWKYFVMQLSFLGWALLCLLTLGIGFLWLDGYMNTAKANFYKMIKGDFDKKEENLKIEQNKTNGEDVVIEADLILDDNN